MTIIDTSPDRPIQLGYEGEDRVMILRFSYSVCLRRNSGIQASLGSEKWAYADAGTIVNAYKIKGVF